MNVKVNGFRAGVMAILLAIGGTGCKRAPFVSMPKSRILPETERVIDSFYNEGLKIKNDTEYKFIKSDTIRLFDDYIENPDKLQQHLKFMSHEDSHFYDENGVEHHVSSFIDPKYIVSNNQIFTRDSIKSYIAVEEYDKIHK